ncbi:hypothetical protein FDB64_05045 [Clostridium botulinum]|nr:hypothetical protein [Clostridium botulinum]NFM04142.1 hypothetical protein [Clostridium botulinum]
MDKNNKTINRTLYFYGLETKTFELAKSPNITYNNKYFLDNTFESGKLYPISNSKVIEIIEFTSEYLFGSIGKLENIKENALKRQRKAKTLETLSDDSILNNILFEDFTYFLIANDFKDIVVLRNSEAPLINNTLPIQLKAKCAELENAWIHPKTIDDLSNELNKYVDLFKVDIAMEHDNSSIVKPTIKEIDYLSKNSLDKVNITLTINKKIGNKEFINQLKQSEFGEYANFKLHAINSETDMIETIDLVTKILTKKISIPITDSLLKDSTSIRKILYTELLANIKRYSSK